MIIGSHVNFSKEQLYGCVKSANSYGANSFMFYTGAPQNTMRSEINNKYTMLAQKLMKENNIDINNIFCHAPYIINLANKNNIDNWNFSILFMQKELNRVQKLGVKYIIIHPGNYLKSNINEAIINISDALNKILDVNNSVSILIESMAGKGTECGKNINELAEIIKNIKKQSQIGVCLDTCHLNDSGVNLLYFDKYLDEFDKYIGISKIKCIHLNDSKNDVGTRKDRHANIGFGKIGFINLINVCYHEKLKDVPKILETPWIKDYPPYKFEIKMLKEKKFNENLYQDVENYYNSVENF